MRGRGGLAINKGAVVHLADPDHDGAEDQNAHEREEIPYGDPRRCRNPVQKRPSTNNRCRDREKLRSLSQRLFQHESMHFLKDGRKQEIAISIELKTTDASDRYSACKLTLSYVAEVRRGSSTFAAD